MRTLKFYYDPISPYVYFCIPKLNKLIQKHNLNIEVYPVLFAGLLNAHINKGPAEIPAKRKYIFTDCLRLSNHYQITFKYPPSHPFNPLLPLRFITSIENHQDRYKFTIQILDAIWGKGLDINDKSLLCSIANNMEGLNSNKLLQLSDSIDIKAQLRNTTESAVSMGIFGVPSFVIDNELFWGHDRIDSIDEYIIGKNNVDYTLLESYLKHPRTADRKI